MQGYVPVDAALSAITAKSELGIAVDLQEIYDSTLFDELSTWQYNDDSLTIRNSNIAPPFGGSTGLLVAYANVSVAGGFGLVLTNAIMIYSIRNAQTVTLSLLRLQPPKETDTPGIFEPSVLEQIEYFNLEYDDGDDELAGIVLPSAETPVPYVTEDQYYLNITVTFPEEYVEESVFTLLQLNFANTLPSKSFTVSAKPLVTDDPGYPLTYIPGFKNTKLTRPRRD